eukprot:Skav224154  [mRNA]  locus=scaffold2488:45307:59148:- [translate_table: standard]
MPISGACTTSVMSSMRFVASDAMCSPSHVFICRSRSFSSVAACNQAKLKEALEGQQQTATKLSEMEEHRQQLLKEVEELQHAKKTAEERPPEPAPAPVDTQTSKLPMGHANLADLVYEATTRREEAVKERHLREQYQQASRASRASRASTSRGASAQAEQLQCQSADAEAEPIARVVERAKKAHDQQRILESHVREVAEQLTVLLHENRQLTGAIPRATSLEMKDYEANKRSFRTIQERATGRRDSGLLDEELIRAGRPEPLPAAVHCTPAGGVGASQSKDEAQKELQMLRDRNNQLDAWLLELAQMALIPARVGAITRVSPCGSESGDGNAAPQVSARGVPLAAKGSRSNAEELAEVRQAAVRAAEDAQNQLQRARQSTTEAWDGWAQHDGTTKVKKQLAEAQEHMATERQNREALQARPIPRASGTGPGLERDKYSKMSEWPLYGKTSEIRAKELQAEVHQAKSEKSWATQIRTERWSSVETGGLIPDPLSYAATTT